MSDFEDVLQNPILLMSLGGALGSLFGTLLGSYLADRVIKSQSETITRSLPAFLGLAGCFGGIYIGYEMTGFVWYQSPTYMPPSP